jgi:flagellar hook-associated protein 1 FlgK
MSMASALSIASSGLANISAQFSVLSQNVSNASTPGYAAEVGQQQDINADGQGLGVRTLPATLAVDQALQSSVITQNATVSGLTTTQTALQAVDGVLGTPGQGTDLGSLLGNLQSSFSTLMNDPSNQTQQAAVVASATTLAQGINTLANAYTAQRQAAQTDLGSAVATLNTALASIGQLSRQIVAAKLNGQGSADLENQRNAAVQTLSGLFNIGTAKQANGDLTVFTTGGLVLPTTGGTPFAIAPGAAQPGSYYPGGGLSGIALNGQDVTGQLTGGQIGADIALRDTTLPTDQAELDEFANGLANRFAAQGLTLFTDGSGNVPAPGSAGGGTPTQSGYVGFSTAIQVNPAVAADPSLVRDGNVATQGSSSGAAAFTPNPAGGPAGFSSLISNVVDYAFGSQAQAGVPQPPLNTSGLGATGGLNAPFSADASLSDFADNLVAAQAQQSASVTASLTTESAVQSSLTAKVSGVSGVNMDSEMSQMMALQTAYSANARIMSTLQSMFTQLLDAVQ